MKKEEKTLDALRRLLIGATIKSIEPPTSSEGVARFNVQRGKDKISFDLCGNDLGSWISAEKKIEAGHELYFDMRQMLDDMANHGIDQLEADPDDIFVPIDSLKIEATGFRCTITGQEWLINTGAALRSEWSKSFESIAARKELALELGGGVIPGDFKINITPEMIKICDEFLGEKE